MIAVTFGVEGPELRDVPEPIVRGPDDVVIRVDSVGICGSDLRMVEAPGDRVGTVMGHEICGIVQAAGPRAELRPGQAVVVNPNVWCQSCWFCRAGMANMCERLTGVGSRIDGGAAPLCRLPARLLHPVPDGLSRDLAALAEPLSCVIRGLRRALDPLASSACILGAGPLGLLALVTLRQSRMDSILVLELHPHRAELAISLGATTVASSSDALMSVRDGLTSGRGVDLVIDTSGGNLALACAMARKGGSVLSLGYGDDVPGPAAEAVVTKELRLTGSFTGRDALPAALDRLRADPVPYARLVSHRMPLAAAAEAIALLRAGAAIKILLQPGLDAFDLRPVRFVGRAEVLKPSG